MLSCVISWPQIKIESILPWIPSKLKELQYSFLLNLFFTNFLKSTTFLKWQCTVWEKKKWKIRNYWNGCKMTRYYCLKLLLSFDDCFKCSVALHLDVSAIGVKLITWSYIANVQQRDYVTLRLRWAPFPPTPLPRILWRVIGKQAYCCAISGSPTWRTTALVTPGSGTFLDNGEGSTI